MPRGRHFAFTFHTDEEQRHVDSAAIQGLVDALPSVRYVIAGFETCPTTGALHFQGHLTTASPISVSAIKCRLSAHYHRFDRIHIEPARNPGASIAYCKKEGDWKEAGEAPVGQGTRTDLQAVTDAVADGQGLKEIARKHPQEFIKYSRGIQALIALQSTGRTEPTAGIWFWGPTGTGKSRTAWELHPDAYSKDPASKWWDGYDGQDVVIIDDFRPSKELPFHQLLRLLDRYPMQVESKGGYLNFNSTKIIFTSCSDPRTTFGNLDWLSSENLDQLERRLIEVRRFGEDPLAGPMAEGFHPPG